MSSRFPLAINNLATSPCRFCSNTSQQPALQHLPACMCRYPSTTAPGQIEADIAKML